MDDITIELQDGSEFMVCTKEGGGLLVRLPKVAVEVALLRAGTSYPGLVKDVQPKHTRCVCGHAEATHGTMHTRPCYARVETTQEGTRGCSCRAYRTELVTRDIGTHLSEAFRWGFAQQAQQTAKNDAMVREFVQMSVGYQPEALADPLPEENLTRRADNGRLVFKYVAWKCMPCNQRFEYCWARREDEKADMAERERNLVLGLAEVHAHCAADPEKHHVVGPIEGFVGDAELPAEGEVEWKDEREEAP